MREPLWQPYVWVAEKVICMNCGAVLHNVKVKGIMNPENGLVFVSLCPECYKKVGTKHEDNCI